MYYFTIYHIIALITIFFIFITFLIYIIKDNKTSKIISLLAVDIFIMSSVAIVAMLIIDEYTKKATITNLSQHRILLNETIVFTGYIKNISNYTITRCNLEIKLVNSPIGRDRLDPKLFKARGFFEVFKAKGNERSIITKNFKIGQKLQINEIRAFSISIPYPANFTTPTLYTELNCH